ncbi:MAG: lysylphosphatidylglycerol synthetase [Anaerophaga sp.]|uniref:lysylphosphatidylglycerol synthase transmembrane domain-containing protein n=1 Tax=Anaerophaga thermohalophila TaxID=177400 RepID=UPI000237B8BC|nr:lysylphosphatidylglycerol synthase transmembrane domain-containing protein [Anaerophaga thermohalophila]MBZ4676905.1 lysylphosphatidylglycerol synthetase [Anaerophaga sp.]MDI3520621.1 glycosyltransferase 2 family protein [Anaerophaga sp.]MDK2842310.1 glycosyltransferase 2 family protein [Anaerophaga sp.]MDN5290451.1 glycosyltransferase 2 family protein [Anaerophaga sp.]
MNIINQKHIKTIKLIAKIFISAGILWYITSKIDIEEIGKSIARANILLLLVALLIYVVSQVAAAFRLNTLFRLMPVNISEKTNIKLYWLGLFYNLFLPGGVGGDGFKVYMLNHYLKVPVKRSLGAIFADRLSGLTIIVTFILVLLHFVDYSFPYKLWLYFAIPVPLIAFYFFLKWVLPLFRKAFVYISLWSVLVQGFQMLAAVSILYALGVENSGSYDDYLFLFFLSAIMASIPVTLGGIGAREFTFLMGAEYLHLQQDLAVALSLLFFSVSAVSALPGLWYTIKPRKILV